MNKVEERTLTSLYWMNIILHLKHGWALVFILLNNVVRLRIKL